MIQPYLFLEGRAEEAIGFYRDAIGAEVMMMMRFREAPPPPPGPAPEGCSGGPTPEMAEKIMHATLRIGGSMLMLSDGHCSGKPSFQGVALSLQAPDIATAEKQFDALAAGGEVRMPLTETFFSPRFGMLADRFGVSWMVLVAQPGASG